MAQHHRAPPGARTSTTAGLLLADPVELASLRRQMLRFASLQLADSDLAEDAVQEALMGAMKNADMFGGRAAFKTWVFAILKYKIADILRQAYRHGDTGLSRFTADDDEDLLELFDRKGFWLDQERPARWGNPELALHDEQFWRVFEACLDRLPPAQGRVFMMRELVELESHEICATVGITVSNLNVMLHRARLRLRECLEDRWFEKEDQSC